MVRGMHSSLQSEHGESSKKVEKEKKGRLLIKRGRPAEKTNEKRRRKEKRRKVESEEKGTVFHLAIFEDALKEATQQGG